MSKAALNGVRIADFSIAWAGAHIGTLLSFFGAEVIKIETRLWPDHTRRLSVTSGETFKDLDHSKAFSYINLNKLSVTLDLTKEEGQELAKKIVEISDVVIENLRFGRMESF
ncbi:MAG: CoA transferase, partial [Pseudomonadota bacterium]